MESFESYRPYLFSIAYRMLGSASVGARQRFVPPAGSQAEMAEVNGEPALIIRMGAQALLVLSIEVEQGRIQAIRIIANPEKLARV